MLRRYEFIDLAISSDTNDCIVWPFAVRKSNGYGAHSTCVKGIKKNYEVHRYVCQHVHGQADIGEEARHACGNSLCINPKHLSWGTHYENMQDAIQQGTIKGGGRYRQRLFAIERAEIKASKESLVTLGSRYGMDPAYIGRVKRLPLQFDL